MSDKQSVGRRGEDAAAAYLEGLGWKIRARNWRCARGEVDIVALDPAGALVFCEVKCRSGLGYGHPIESVTAAKCAKLRQLAQTWLATVGRFDGPVRIDALGVVLRRGWAPQITHVRGAA